MSKRYFILKSVPKDPSKPSITEPVVVQEIKLRKDNTIEYEDVPPTRYIKILASVPIVGPAHIIGDIDKFPTSDDLVLQILEDHKKEIEESSLGGIVLSLGTPSEIRTSKGKKFLQTYSIYNIDTFYLYLSHNK